MYLVDVAHPSAAVFLARDEVYLLAVQAYIQSPTQKSPRPTIYSTLVHSKKNRNVLWTCHVDVVEREGDTY